MCQHRKLVTLYTVMHQQKPTCEAILGIAFAIGLDRVGQLRNQFENVTHGHAVQSQASFVSMSQYIRADPSTFSGNLHVDVVGRAIATQQNTN